MPVRREEAHRALELLEEYHKRLVNPQDRALRLAIEKVIRIFKSRLFNALMDIQEYYEVTLLDDTKSTQQKTSETLHVAAKWDKQPLLPPQSNNDRRPVMTQPSEDEPLPPPPPEMVAAAAPVIASRAPPPVQAKPKKAAAVPPPVSPVKQQPVADDASDGHYASVNGGDGDWEYEEVVLERGSGGLGFSIAGGRDMPHIGTDPSVYITKVIDGGTAARDGRIRTGDVLVSINDKSVENVYHADVVDALKKAGNTVRLMIRRPRSSGEKVLELFLTKGSKGLGFSIAGGKGNQHIPGDDGVFITKVIDGGAAQQDGHIAVGDRLIAVNDIRFDSITHEEAVAVLKSTSDRVRLLIGKPPYNAAENEAVLRAKRADPASAQYGSDSSPVYATVNKANRSSAGEPKISREPRKIIMRKGTSGLGFNIVGGEDGEGIFVSFILAGGPADLSGELHKGDQLISVNRIDLTNATHEQAAAVLKASSDVVEIVAQYKPDEYTRFEAKINSLRENIMSTSTSSLRTSQKKTMFVRALFDYDASSDSGLPSRGLSFNFGDVLHVTNASDDDWWQARRVFPDADDDSIGIIPSKKRVEKKERARLRNVKFPGGTNTAEKKKKGKKFPFMKSGKEDEGSNEDLSMGDEPVLSYELVTQQEVRYARPVLVLGPLKDRVNDDLLADFPGKFGNCVPHTTRARRDNEVDGRDYHFISREQMDQDINNHLFIEAGQYNNNLYGTSVASVREVADSGRHCVLDLSGLAIKRLLATGLYPIAILTKPTSPENVMAWTDADANESQKQYEKTVKLEEELKEYFTAIAMGDSPDDVYAAVKDIIQQHSSSNVWVATGEKL